MGGLHATQLLPGFRIAKNFQIPLTFQFRGAYSSTLLYAMHWLVGSPAYLKGEMLCMRTVLKSLTILVVLLLPATVFAQASLTGTVRDASGGVLPGVTVEAASPALIEKVRTAITDGAGQYRIVDLRAGTYSLTFTLPGFNVVRRDNIELTGSQTLTIPAEMRVGGIQETITVTGESPVVDVQSARREVVIDNNLIQTIPASRAAGALLNVTPGLTVDGNGIALSPTMTFFSANGGANNEGRMAVNGMTVGAARSGGVSSYVYDAVGVDEVSIRVGGGLGETDTGGPIMNIVPRSGGNTFSGTAFTSLAGDWSRGDNLNDELRAFGLTETPGIIQAHDASFSLGGPILRDRLWFYGQYRNLDTQTAVEGITANANAGNAARWDWMSSPVNARLVQDRMMAMGRFAAQLGRSRFNVNYEYQKRCEGTPLNVGTDGCHKRGEDWVGLGTTTQSPEATGTAGRGYFEWPFHLTQTQWTMPVTGKLLFDASVTFFRYNPAFGFPPPDGITNLIPVTEQSGALACTNANPALRHPGCTAQNEGTLRWAPAANYAYRGLEQWGYAEGATNSYNAGATYVTGSHSVKVGYQQVLAAAARRDHRAGQPARLPLQPGRAQSCDLSASDAEQQHGHPAARHLPAGPVHARPLDPVWRASMGSGEQLCAGRGQRRVRNLLPESGADYVREDAWRGRVQRHQPARGRRLRRVRHWQDGFEVPLGQVSGVCIQRSAVHVHEPRGHAGGDGQPRLDGQR